MIKQSPAGRRWVELAITVHPELAEPLMELFTKRGKAAVAIEELAKDDLPDPDLSHPSFERSGREGPASSPGLGVPSPAGWAGPTGATTVTLRAYLPSGLAGQRRIARIEAGLAVLNLIVPMPPLLKRTLDADEWESVLRGHFTTLRVGKRMVVCPAWETYQAAPGEVILLLDPGASFGTGHHPTTRLSLELLEQRVRPGCSVLDVGTGSGILALAAAKLGAASVLGVDTDPLAVRMARRNVRMNGVQKAVRLQRGSLPLPGNARFDVAVANITAAVLEAIMPHLKACLSPVGNLLLSGLLEPQLPSLAAKAAEWGLTIAETRTEADWVALRLVASPSP